MRELYRLTIDFISFLASSALAAFGPRVPPNFSNPFRIPNRP